MRTFKPIEEHHVGGTTETGAAYRRSLESPRPAGICGRPLGAGGGGVRCCSMQSVPSAFWASHLALSVMLEVALNQVDVWGAQAGLVVAGYYHANAALDDLSAGPLALKIAGRIAEFFPGAVLIMLDNQKLVSQPHVPPVIVLENHGLRWVPKDKNLVMWRDWEESRQMVGALLEGRAHQHLVDFDCHLDDIRQDWTNQQLNTQITQWVGPTNGKT
ncbi:ER membrane protein complex subunit 9 isoform X1 [Lontra canadensis]|uniref:ER membrane protein complex subunit 9 isoform X1 n=1 Tax=Lontra canadensis TaxID=76717 RepID=UPI0013F329C9|nr:ER membrane protein complex subunit 9 isoform X1 [Lontra canadensis]